MLARATASGIEISVSDSGLGLPAQDEAQDPSQNEKDDAGTGMSPTSTSYGLQHVRDRLRVIYGPTARLTLQRRDPAGVCAVVFIPT